LQAPASLPRCSPCPRLFFVAALFLAIWGAKLIVIDRFGSDLPYWDQWIREGEMTYAPWFDRGELWQNLFTPHVEHRIVPTLVLNFGLLLIGGQWDARVQCVANAALHAAIAATLFGWALYRLRPYWAAATGITLAVVTALPLSPDNIIRGFQSVYFFTIAFSFLAMGGLLRPRAFSLAWWGGLLAGLIALVSLGSGFLCAVPILAIGGLRWVFRLGPRRDAIATLLAALLLLALGWYGRVMAPSHAPLQAHSLEEFLLFYLRCLAWPRPEWPWLAGLFWAPWLVLLVQRWRTRQTPDLAADFILATGCWVHLQAAAGAYARGTGGLPPTNRYGDLFTIGLALSCCAFGLLAARRPRRWLIPANVLWLLVLTASAVWAVKAVQWPLLKAHRIQSLTYERNVGAFMLTGDYETFAVNEQPFPITELLGKILRRPSIRRVLPASVRVPVAVPGFDDTLPAGAPPLPYRHLRLVHGADEWRSTPLVSSPGWWKFETLGVLAAPGATFELVALADRRVLGAAAPLVADGKSWRTVYLPAPGEPATLVVRTGTGTDWFAFTQPVKVTSLGYRTEQFTRQGYTVIGLGILVLVLGLVLARPHGKGLSQTPFPLEANR